MEHRSMPLRNGCSEVLVNQIMGTFGMSQAEAADMALSMLIRELLMAVNMEPVLSDGLYGVA